MSFVTININGTDYPCRPTMGALLRFRRETGREVTEMNGSLEDLCTYLWCCVCSASRRENIPFDMSLMDFADAISPELLTQWANDTQKQAAGKESHSEKKTSA